MLNFDVNHLFLTLIICSKMSWFVNIFLKDHFVNFFALMVVLQKRISYISLIRRLSCKSCHNIFLSLGLMIPEPIDEIQNGVLKKKIRWL